MVSVAFAIWLFPHASFGHPPRGAGDAHCLCLPYLAEQATCQFCGRTGTDLASILHSNTQCSAGLFSMMSMFYQAFQNHMDLTEPWRSGAASALKYLNLVPQGASDAVVGRLTAALELISRAALTYAPGLRHRQRYGRQSRDRRRRGDRLCHAVRLAPAFQEGRGNGAAAPAAGRADVR